MIGHTSRGGLNGQIGTNFIGYCRGGRIEYGCSTCTFGAALRLIAQSKLSANRRRPRGLCRSLCAAHAEIKTERQTRSIRGQLSVGVHYLSCSPLEPDLHITWSIVRFSCTIWLKPERQPHGTNVY